MILYYDPVQQYYILAPHHDPTGPLFVPQEALKHHDPTGPLFVPQETLNDDFLLPSSHVPIRVAYFFQKMNKLVKTPRDDALVIPHLYKTFH